MAKDKTPPGLAKVGDYVELGETEYVIDDDLETMVYNVVEVEQLKAHKRQILKSINAYMGQLRPLLVHLSQFGSPKSTDSPEYDDLVDELISSGLL